MHLHTISPADIQQQNSRGHPGCCAYQGSAPTVGSSDSRFHAFAGSSSCTRPKLLASVWLTIGVCPAQCCCCCCQATSTKESAAAADQWGTDHGYQFTDNPYQYTQNPWGEPHGQQPDMYSHSTCASGLGNEYHCSLAFSTTEPCQWTCEGC